MKKRILGILTVFMALTMIFTMTSCGDNGTDDPSITSVTVTAAGGATSVAKGASLQFNAAVVAKGGAKTDVTWTKSTTTSTDTTLSAAGLLSVGADETATSITVTATSDFDTTKSNSATVSVGSGTVVNPTDITFGLTQKDGINGTADTTAIDFLFSAAVTGLEASEIALTPSTVATAGALTGSGTAWSLAITVVDAGQVTVTITKEGVSAAPVTVDVYKAGVTLAEWTITWNFNEDAEIVVDKGGAVYPTKVSDGGLLTEPTPEPTAEGYTFLGWFSASAAYDFSAAVTADLTLSAEWEQDEEPVDEPKLTDSLGEAVDGEVISLGNAWFAIYRFDLPAGKAWEDYSGVTAEYLVGDESTWTATNSVRTIRLLGPYQASDFVPYEYEATGYKIAVASYNDGKNAPFILHNGPAWTTFAAAFPDASPGEWFTFEYTTDGTSYGDYDQANLPAPDATGPFYFGIGLPSASSDNANTFLVKNVTLVGVSAADSVIGTPGQFEEIETGEILPAYTGWTTQADGIQSASRGANKVAFAQVEPVAVEQVSLGNAWFAVYRFDLPEGKAWEDYTSVTAEYLVPSEETWEASNSVRTIRLMGPYKASDFESYEYEETGYKTAIAPYGSGKNAPYILHNGPAWTTFAAAFPDSAAGEWFSFSYTIDGTSYGDYNQDNLPAPDAAGPFYFGLGVPSASSDDANTFMVKNITLVGVDSADDVIATPGYAFNASGELVPLYTGWTTQADGIQSAARGEGYDPGPFELGDVTWVNNANQKGWKANGTDGDVTNLPLGKLINAKTLVLEVTTLPTGGGQIIWQGDADSSWKNKQIFNNSGGTAMAENGVTIEGNTITIDLELALPNYDDFIACTTWCKFLIQYYGANSAAFDDLGITSAILY